MKSNIKNWKWWITMLPICLILVMIMAPFVLIRKSAEILLAIATLIDISELREPEWFKSLSKWVNE